MGDSAASESRETFGEKNAKHFDKVAPSEWPQWIVDLQQQIVDFLVSPDFPSWAGMDINTQAEAQGSKRRMLDYACGDGLLSKALKPLYASVIGVDVSGAMLDKYRATTSSLGLSEEEMMGVRGDFITGASQATEPPLPEEALGNFDMVAMSMALHHVEDAPVTMRELASRLKVGGKILIVDWAPLDGSTAAQRDYQEELRKDNKEAIVKERLAVHAARHTVGKPEGFTEAEQRLLFEQASCRDFAWKLADTLSYVEPVDAKGQLYWALATKA
ncbi:methyltransferase type 11 [Colletotrichum musicola]|uniref:Methyltransferase type 11 n=1 Tax=Colletotrichum musicola TaxID=2175873 RepID=A0A8H6KXZ3_9PEZI|nr:methyltransferase type 11 [Colletotrichum musicola]